jgi:type 1 fimbria pilin
MDISTLAEGLVRGEITCDECSILNSKIQEVKDGKISIDQFKEIVADNINEVNTKKLQEVVK